MHDANGKLLAVGDTVHIPCVILELSPGEETCNCSLETVLGRRPDRRKERYGSTNTGQVVWVEPGFIGPGFGLPSNWPNERLDGSPRHASVAGVLKHFNFDAKCMPLGHAVIRQGFVELAVKLANSMPESPDVVCGLRELLAAQDNFIRASDPPAARCMCGHLDNLHNDGACVWEGCRCTAFIEEKV